MIGNGGQNPQTDGFITEDNEPYVMKNMRVKKKMSVVIKILIAFGVLIGIAILILGLVILKKVKEREKYKDPVFIQQDVTKYLEERYGEKFVVTFNRGTGPAYNYVQLFAYPEGYDDEKHKIEIQGYYNKKGELEYFDSYVMVKLTDEYEAYIDPIIGEYFDEYKFYMEFDGEWLTSNLPADTKLEDLWELKAGVDYILPGICLFINSNSESNHNVLEKLVDELAKNHVRCAGYVAYFSDGEKYDLLVDDWNTNVTGLNYKNDIETFLIYDKNKYEFTKGEK